MALKANTKRQREIDELIDQLNEGPGKVIVWISGEFSTYEKGQLIPVSAARAKKALLHKKTRAFAFQVEGADLDTIPEEMIKALKIKVTSRENIYKFLTNFSQL
ncbi:MAG: hypothetical protein U5K32_12895 [Bacteroidales bacterium]|nr:hypothetical protein [Bacteroidales bacterium]